jgi:DHA2 family multidrug resistance protein-like MFS transporter
MSAAPPEKAGSVGSLSSTSGELGVALGVAVLGSVTTAVYRGAVTVPGEVAAEASAAARESIAGAVATAEQLPGALGADLLEAAQAAFTTSLHVTGVVIGVAMLGLAALAVARLRHVPPTGGAEPAGDHEPVGDHDPVAPREEAVLQPAG